MKKAVQKQTARAATTTVCRWERKEDKRSKETKVTNFKLRFACLSGFDTGEGHWCTRRAERHENCLKAGILLTFAVPLQRSSQNVQIELRGLCSLELCLMLVTAMMLVLLSLSANRFGKALTRTLRMDTRLNFLEWHAEAWEAPAA